MLDQNLRHLVSPLDENEMAIEETSIRTIQNLSCCHEQTIVGGPNFNLTNRYTYLLQKMCVLVKNPYCVLSK